MEHKPEQNSFDFTQISPSLPKIASFLTQNERINLASTNKFFKEFILSTNCWGTFQIYDRAIAGKNNLNNFFEWVFKYLRIIKPASLVISIFQSSQYEEFMMKLLIEGPIDSVQKLDLFYESDDIHLAASLCFPNLTQLTLRSLCVSDQLVQFMFENMKNVTCLTIIKNDMNFTCKNLSVYCNNSFEKLELKPYLLNFQQIKQITQKSASTLRELEIDVEECENEMIVQIIAPLKNLQKLRVYHLQNLYTDDQLVEIIEKTDSLYELTATKAYNFPMTRVIKSLKSTSLLTLDLTDSRYFNDDDLVCLTENSPNLKNLNISWCNALTVHSLQVMVQKFLKLQYLNITGVKQAKDLIFKDYLYLIDELNQDKFIQLKLKIKNEHKKLIKKKGQEVQDLFDIEIPIFNRKLDSDRSKIKTLRNLKRLDCTSCNGISDKILNLIYLVNRKVKAYNYYGNMMTIFVDQSEDDFY